MTKRSQAPLNALMRLSKRWLSQTKLQSSSLSQDPTLQWSSALWLPKMRWLTKMAFKNPLGFSALLCRSLTIWGTTKLFSRLLGSTNNLTRNNHQLLSLWPKKRSTQRSCWWRIWMLTLTQGISKTRRFKSSSVGCKLWLLMKISLRSLTTV